MDEVVECSTSCQVVVVVVVAVADQENLSPNN